MNQYIWLRMNLDRYQYLTEPAKELYKAFQEIPMENGMPADDAAQLKLQECYERFLYMFNNNPFDYENGLRDCGIETSELDCYFVKRGDSTLPIGYYKAERPVESVLLLSDKTKGDKEEAELEKERLFRFLETDSSQIRDGYVGFKNKKQASFWRAGIAIVAGVMLVWYMICFLRFTNILNIITSIGNAQVLKNAIESGMESMPILSNSGVWGFVLMLCLHIALLVVVALKIKAIRLELIRSYQRTITKAHQKTTEADIGKAKLQYTDNVCETENRLLETSRQGGELSFEKKGVARLINKAQKHAKTAHAYLQLNNTQLRGIDSNITLIFAGIVVLFYICSYTLLANPTVHQKVDMQLYSWRVAYDTASLRSKKLVQIKADNCEVYRSPNGASNVQYTLPYNTEVELVERKDDWIKIKKNTGTEFIEGWVMSHKVVAYNDVDYNAFREIAVSDWTASSYRSGEGTSHLPENVSDWDRVTVWQDGNESESGTGEYITIRFNNETTVHMIQIFPGHSKRDDLFYRNERIRTADIEFSNGQSVTYEFDDTYTEEYQTIWLNKPVQTSYIKIEVTDIYEGSQYTDLCVGEIHAYQKKEAAQ